MKTIVIGSLNTDLVATGVKQFPKPGEHVYGKQLLIGPGGKSRNIADMLAHLAPSDSVAMVGRTVKDPYGLWRAPLDALETVGVNTDYVNVLEYEAVNKLPGIALIPVNEQGQNQIFVLPGISDDFSVADIDAAADLFKAVGANNGALVLTLECPLDTAVHAVKQANSNGLKVMLDPGGIEHGTDLSELLSAGIYLIKPNEHEAKMLTDVDVTDLASATEAASKLHELGIDTVLITHGANGAYLCTADEQLHLPIPQASDTGEKDETGCGDQTMAALCAFLQENKPIKDAAELAILAGTLQFHKSGIKPVAMSELTSNGQA